MGSSLLRPLGRGRAVGIPAGVGERSPRVSGAVRGALGQSAGQLLPGPAATPPVRAATRRDSGTAGRTLRRGFLSLHLNKRRSLSLGRELRVAVRSCGFFPPIAGCRGAGSAPPDLRAGGKLRHGAGRAPLEPWRGPTSQLSQSPPRALHPIPPLPALPSPTHPALRISALCARRSRRGRLGNAVLSRRTRRRGQFVLQSAVGNVVRVPEGSAAIRSHAAPQLHVHGPIPASRQLPRGMGSCTQPLVGRRCGSALWRSLC